MKLLNRGDIILLSADAPDALDVVTWNKLRQLLVKDKQHGKGQNSMRHGTFSEFFTNLDQPMPWSEKLSKLSRNLWRRVVLRQACCGNHGEPGC